MPYIPPAKKPFEYGELVTGAFRLIWRHKFLWFFGLFAGTGSSLGGWNCNSPSPGDGAAFPTEAADWVDAHLVLLLSILAAVVVLGIILWLWSILCQGAVIKSVRDIRLGQPASFGAAFRNGRESFGRLLLLYLFLFLLGVGIAVIIMAVAVLLIFLAEAGTVGEVVSSVITTLLILMVVGLMLTSFSYLLLCTAFIVLPLLVMLVLTFSIRAAVLEGLRPIAALSRGVKILLANLSRSLLLFLLTLGLSIGAGIAIAFITFVVAIPSLIAWIATYNMGMPLPWIIISSLLFVPALAALITAAALTNTYFATYWTDVYLQFTGVIEDGSLPEEQTAPSLRP